MLLAHLSLGQSPTDRSCCLVEGVPTELSVLPKLLRPSSKRTAFKRAGMPNWHSLQRCRTAQAKASQGLAKTRLLRGAFHAQGSTPLVTAWDVPV